jgi:RNA polymerase sigma-70 factor (ECF subfamily)
MSPQDPDAFHAQRGRLTRLAYRMLGSLAEAEDVVQDAWLRWRGAEAAEITDPVAWLVRVTTRLCIDRLRADQAQRKAYRGPWLPEPLIEEVAVDPVERAEDVSVAFLLALERLSPLERAVFLLHEAFDADYGAIARTLGRSEAACRQLASRAKAHVQAARPRFHVPDAEAARLAAAFVQAAQDGDWARLGALLAEDAILISDGGGKRAAALRPMVGREDVMGLIRGLIWRGHLPLSAPVRLARINGALGAIIDVPDGPETMAFEVGEDGLISAIYVVRNPDKLGRLASR